MGKLCNIMGQLALMVMLRGGLGVERTKKKLVSRKFNLKSICILPRRVEHSAVGVEAHKFVGQRDHVHVRLTRVEEVGGRLPDAIQHVDGESQRLLATRWRRRRRRGVLARQRRCWRGGAGAGRVRIETTRFEFRPGHVLEQWQRLVGQAAVGPRLAEVTIDGVRLVVRGNHNYDDVDDDVVVNSHHFHFRYRARALDMKINEHLDRGTLGSLLLLLQE